MGCMWVCLKRQILTKWKDFLWESDLSNLVEEALDDISSAVFQDSDVTSPLKATGQQSDTSVLPTTKV